MPVYSHSQLSTFEQCPLRYKFKYVDRIPSPEERTAEAVVGSLVHETLEKLYEDLKYEKPQSLEDLLEYYAGQWRRNWSAGIRMLKAGLGEENYRDYGARCIRNYYQRYYPFTQSQTLATEQYISFHLDPERLFAMRGYIDRVARRSDGTYEIHDYKTGGRLPDQASADSDRQLPLYEIGLRLRWKDVERVDLIWHYLGFDFTLISRRSPSQLQNLSRETVDLISRIEACRSFPPVKSALCDWCEYRPICPLWKHVVAVEAMPPEAIAQDVGVRLANEYAEVKRQMEQLRQRLEVLRETIVDFALSRGVSVLQGNGVRVSVSQSTHFALPTRNDLKREELEKFVDKIDRWSDVGELSASRCADVLKSEKWPAKWLETLRGFLSSRHVSILRVSRAGKHEEAEPPV